jgi:hypothetical protein
MCDYSLMAIPNRMAVSGDDLVVHRFGAGPVGLASACDLRRGQEPRKSQSHGFWSKLNEFFSPSDVQSIPAVCIPPGAQLLVQDIPLKLQREYGLQEVEKAVFTQVSAEVNTFRDAIRLPNGVRLLLQRLDEGQRVRILDLSPAEDRATAPKERQTEMEYSSRSHI